MHRTHAGHGSIWPSEAVEARASDQSTLTPERIAELRALLAKATPGPWHQHVVDDTTIIAEGGFEIGSTWPGGGVDADRDFSAPVEQHEHNAALIVAMRNDLPDLLDAAERASRAREDALREAADAGDCIHAIERHKPDGEYAEGYRASAADYQAAILALIDKPKGGDANGQRNPRAENTKRPATSPGVITGASGEAKQLDPDWFWCEIDPDESGDSAYQAMHSYRPRLEPVELCTSYVGPRLWGVMSPPLPDADNDEETAHTFDTLEAARAFCDERNAIFNGAALCPSEGGDRG